MPFAADASLPQRHAMRLGVFDRRGAVLRNSLLFRTSAQIGHAAVFDPSATRDGRTVIYGGNLSPHFGHFLLESLARLWYAREHPEWPIVWAARARNPKATIRTWQWQVLEALGLHNEVILLREPTRFATVHVPQPGYRIKDFFAAQHAAFLASYPARPRDPSLRLWLSRAGLLTPFGSIHAPRLDRILADRGWTVIQPERLPIAQQLELLATASRVAGEQGSAFHLLILLQDVRDLEVDIICRRPDLAIEEQNPNYDTIAAARGVRQRLHVVPEERLIGIDGPQVRKLATTLAGHLEVLGLPRSMAPGGPVSGGAGGPVSGGPGGPGSGPSGPVDGSAGMVTAAPMARMAQHVVAATGARSCLEVGVVAEAPVADIAIEQRDVVRPAFADDPRLLARDGLRPFELPPDEFFTYLAERDRRYDLIVLDGFASVAAALATIVAARRHAGPGTTWLVRGVDATGRRLVDDGWWRTTRQCWLASPPGSDTVADMLAVLRPASPLLVVDGLTGPCSVLPGESADLDPDGLRAAWTGAVAAQVVAESVLRRS